MQKIDTTQIVDPTSLQPFTGRSLEFLQDSLDIDKAGIIKAFITQTVGSYSLTVPYVISGCVVSDSGKDVTAGEIFYGGKFYETTAVNGTTNVARFILTKTQDATADPVDFSDGASKNVHDIYKYVPTDVGSGGDFTSAALVSAYGTGKITSQLAQATFSTSSTSYVDVTGMSYTNSSGSTKTFHIVGKLYMDTTAHAANFSFLQLWDGTNELDLTVAGGTGLGVNGYWCLTVSYVGSITNGTVLKLRLKNGSASQVDFAAITMTVIEI